MISRGIEINIHWILETKFGDDPLVMIQRITLWMKPQNGKKNKVYFIFLCSNTFSVRPISLIQVNNYWSNFLFQRKFKAMFHLPIWKQLQTCQIELTWSVFSVNGLIFYKYILTSQKHILGPGKKSIMERLTRIVNDFQKARNSIIDF